MPSSTLATLWDALLYLLCPASGRQYPSGSTLVQFYKDLSMRERERGDSPKKNLNGPNIFSVLSMAIFLGPVTSPHSMNNKIKHLAGLNRYSRTEIMSICLSLNPIRY